ncbi:MAG: helix-turn-helix transcriptional regulator [Oscillibacter sp.]|nr:helix-turn-helix transcriptional regulator [Oscillibacter sp.]
MMFSEHLLELRTKAGLTQQETAKGSKMSLRAYQNYEWGLREPKMTALIALADFYDISLDELACRTWPKKPEA